MNYLDEENILDAMDKVLATREQYSGKLKRIYNIVEEGIKKLNEISRMPDKWYVEKPSKEVVDYINNKHNTSFSYNTLNGLGESFGEVLVVPHDIKFSFWITNQEFLKLTKN